MEAKALSVLRSDVRIASDTEGQLLRHPNSELDGFINEGVRAYRNLVTVNGYDFFLTSTAATTLVGTEVADETYFEIPVPATAARIVGVDVRYTSTPFLWAPLKPVTQMERRDYQQRPPISASGEYKIWYLPNPTTLSGDTDNLVLPAEGLAWVTAYAAVEVCRKDDDPEGTMQGLMQKMQLIEQRTYPMLPKIMQGGSFTPRRRGARHAWWGDPGFFVIRTMPEGSGSGVTTGAIQLFLNYWV